MKEEDNKAMTDNQLFNIIILTDYEYPIAWLNPDKCEIVETNKKGTQKSISLTYPLESRVTGDEKQWFEQGNKIYIPDMNGLDACLYVINTTYSLDFWENNEVTVQAEEVLTEFNYQMFMYSSATELKLNRANFEAWFGDFYKIGTIDTLPNSAVTSLSKGKSISPAGTMTKMSLLRLIEEETGYYWKTKYTNTKNVITRTLSLRKQENMEENNNNNHPGIYYLDLGYNIESLELDVDESDTYTAMAPVISLQETNTDTTGTVTSTDTTSLSTTTQAATSNTTTNREELTKILNTWKALQVDQGTQIPMIIESQSDGSYKYTSKWKAPFQKDKDSIEIYDTTYTNTRYNRIVPTNAGKTKYPTTKVGTVQTSEKDHYAIYNVLANKLLQKRTPDFTLKCNVKDIQEILGVNNLGYNLWDTVKVKIPGFDYYVTGMITETKKNPHNPGENTITITSEVSVTHLQETTLIQADNRIVDNRNTQATLGGILKTDTGTALNGEQVDISLTLIEAYDESTDTKTTDDDTTDTKTTDKKTTTDTDTDKTKNQIQEVLDFKPDKEKYIFTEFEIKNMAKTIKNHIIDNKKTPQSVNMRTVAGKIYRVPLQWCRAIWYTRNQWYIHQDLTDSDHTTDVGKNGKFPSSIAVYHVPNIIQEYQKAYKNLPNNPKSTPLYSYASTWASFFYQAIQTHRDYISKKFFNGKQVTYDAISSGEYQSGGTCVPSSMSNGSEKLWNYYTEVECIKCFGTVEQIVKGGVYPDDYHKISKLGFKGYWIDATWTNAQKYMNSPQYAVCFSTRSDYLNSAYTGEGYHTVCGSVGFTATDGRRIVYYEDTNIPYTTPIITAALENTYVGADQYITWEKLYNAIDAVWTSYNRTEIASYWKNPGLRNNPKAFFVMELQSSQRSLDVIDRTVKSDSKFNPWGLSYSFNSETIKKAYKDMIQTTYKNNPYNNLNTQIFTLTDVNGQTWKMNGKWIYALLWAYAYNYRNNTTTTKKETSQTITVNNNSNAMWYYKTNDTVYNWWSLSYPNNELYRLLPVIKRDDGSWDLGDVIILQKILYDNGTYKNLKEIYDVVKKNGFWNTTTTIDKNIKTFNIKCTIENLKKYGGWCTICSSMVVNDTFRKLFKNSMNMTEPNKWFRIIITNVDTTKNTGTYFLWGENGNSPTNNPNTPGSNSSSNPYWDMALSDLVSNHKQASKLTGSGDEWTCYSIWTKQELDKIQGGN